MANCLFLHDSCITNLEFMNYAFANLVVTWLYRDCTEITLTKKQPNYDPFESLHIQ